MRRVLAIFYLQPTFYFLSQGFDSLKENDKGKKGLKSKFKPNSRFKSKISSSLKFDKLFKSDSTNKNSFKNVISSISNKFDDLTGINENKKNKRVNTDNIDNNTFNKDVNVSKDGNINKNLNVPKDGNFRKVVNNNGSIDKDSIDKNIIDKEIDNNKSSLDIKTPERFIKHLNLNNKGEEFLQKDIKNKKFSNDEDIIKSINNIKNIRKNGLNNNHNNLENKIQDNPLKDIRKNSLNKSENYDDSYYRQIEPTKEEIKHENYLKELKNHNLEDKKNKLDFKKVLKLDKDSIRNFKDSLNDNEESKTILGAAIFGLIIIVLLFSSYYFFFYQPFQDELATAKTNKLNELNSLFKGPLALDENVLPLTSEIELASSPEEVNSIDILRPATSSWRDYQTKQINKTKDDFNRVMVSYESSENGSNGVLNNKNVIMNIADAELLVNQNDGNVLSKVVFKKPDTVAIPILVTRLQAGAGLISVGSVVDIYTLSDPNSQTQSYGNSPSSSDGSNNNPNNNSSLDNNNNNKENNQSSENSQSNGNIGANNPMEFESKGTDKFPVVSGSTVLAIMRSKDSGVINANYIKSQTTINGNLTNQNENSKSFSTDVEEMLRGSISGGFNEKQIASLLNKYGLKLSDYERQSNLGELDVQYLLLIEVPREDVPYLINNMDNIILTIPTANAPNWMVTELKSTYL